MNPLWWIPITILAGLILDEIDYLTYEPPGTVGLSRQRGWLGHLGRLLCLGGIAALIVQAVRHMME